MTGVVGCIPGSAGVLAGIFFNWQKVAAPSALITPALFSQPPSQPPGEEGDCFKLVFKTPSLPAVGSAVGERGKGE